MTRICSLATVAILCMTILRGAASATPTVHVAPDPSPEPAAAVASQARQLGAARFEPNAGQLDSRVKFVARAGAASVFLTPCETVIAVDAQKQADVRIRFDGANATARFEGERAAPGTTNHFRGSDPTKWRAGVRAFEHVRVRDLYEGIDALYYGATDGIEYDFVVAPGADPRAIQMKIGGAQRISMDEAGDLVLETSAGTLRQRQPVAYQMIDGVRLHVAVRYDLAGATGVRFAVGAFDVREPLVIDPVFVFSTFLSGSQHDVAGDVAMDSAGNVYVAGTTFSPDFPTVMPVDGTRNGIDDAFVSKLSADGQTLVYSTLLGGSQFENAIALAVDGSGAVYLTGSTGSPDFPLVNPLDATFGGGSQSPIDAFVTKISPSGASLEFSTYLGGSEFEFGTAIDVDGTGAVFVAGETASTNFPVTPGAFQSTYAGSASNIRGDAFVVKIAPGGSSFAYATYLGGGANDGSTGLDVAANGEAVVVGNVDGFGGAPFPTANALFSVRSGSSDAFVTRLNSAGSGLVFSTYYGGSSSDRADGVALDNFGNIAILGTTRSSDIPLVNPIQSTLPIGGYDELVVAKLNAAGSSLLFSTYLGTGEYEELGSDVACDGLGDVYVLAQTQSTNMLVVNPLQTVPQPGQEETSAWTARVAADGSAVKFATYLGGDATDRGTALCVSIGGVTGIVGSTYSHSFPVFRPRQSYPIKLPDPEAGAPASVYVTKIAPTGAGIADLSISVTSGPVPVPSVGIQTYVATVTNAGPDPATHVTFTCSTPVGYVFTTETSTFYPGFHSSSSSQGILLGAPAVGGVGGVTYSLGTLPAGQSAVVSVSFSYNVVTESEDFNVEAYHQVHAAEVDPTALNNAQRLVSTIRPIPPSAPGLEAIPISVATINLNGGLVYIGNADTIEFERRVGTSGPFEVIAILDANQPEYSDRGLMGGTAYTYRARAQNVGGYSPYSPEVMATTEVGSCSYLLFTQEMYFNPKGGEQSVTVQTPTGCPIAASSPDSWITVVPPDLFSDSVGVFVSAGPPAEGRIGHIDVAGTTIPVVQRSTASGPDSVGVYIPSTGAWFLKNLNTSGSADNVFTFGAAGVGWIPLAGDWNGDGVSTPGVFVPSTSTFFLKDTNAPGGADHVFSFGPAGAGWIPIVGDWLGDGDDEIGLYDPATGAFFINYELVPGPANEVFTFGPGGAGWIPVVGNFDSGVDDEIAMYDPTSGTFFVKYQLFGGPADLVFSFGPGGVNWKPLAGDWNHDGHDGVALYDPATGAIFMRNTLADGPADWLYTYGPSGAVPIVGNWDGL